MPEGRGFLLATDGLIEARGPKEHAGAVRLLGSDRIDEVLGREKGRSAQRIVDGLAEAAREHSGDRLADDVCIVAARSVART
jgi:serine phosphatase RsbU (regulator of sigma subunit)